MTLACHCVLSVYGVFNDFWMEYEVFSTNLIVIPADGSRVDYLKMSESELFLQNYSSEVAKLKFLHPEKLSENRVGENHFLFKSNIFYTEEVSFY